MTLSQGWMLPYLLAADDLTWKRWSHWCDLMLARAVAGGGIQAAVGMNRETPGTRETEFAAKERKKRKELNR